MQCKNEKSGRNAFEEMLFVSRDISYFLSIVLLAPTYILGSVKLCNALSIIFALIMIVSTIAIKVIFNRLGANKVGIGA